MNRILGIILVTFSYSVMRADKIYITNKTDKIIYAAFYYTKGVTSELMKDIAAFTIEPGATRTVERPEFKLYFGGTSDRDLYFGYANDFPDIIQKGSRHFVNLGSTRGTDFYIAENEYNQLDGYNALTWAARPAIKAIESTIYTANRNTLLKTPFANKDARVRTGSAIASEEIQFLQNRSSVSEKAINALLDMQTEKTHTPRIAVCYSGGGYRAMISTAGFIQGAQKIGLLDAISYQAGLSGSTWAISGWLQSGKNIDSFMSDLYEKLHIDIKNNVDILQTTNALLNNLSFNIPISPIDVWGSLIAQKVLLPDSGKFTIADLTAKTNPAKHPYPLFTAVMSSRSLQDIKPWVEFTLHEVGSTYFNAFIPNWAFGRRFEKGLSDKQGFSVYPPAQPLSFCMGIWGSAIAINLQEFIQDKFGTAAGKDILNALKGSALIENRIAAADVFNWTYLMAGSRLSDLPKFQLVDAGLDFNLALPPLLRPERAIDIIIVLDASASVVTNPAAQLKKAEEYAQKNNLKFPIINYSTTKNNCSVHFGDRQKGIPTIIYIPVIANPGYQNGWYSDPKNNESYTRTNNFIYNRDQIKQLSGLVEYTIIASKDTIVDAIKQAALE